MDEADKIVRYCPECGHIGAVKPHLLTCCPDSCGMSMKRWQAEKLERVLDRARGQRRSPPSAPRAEAVEAISREYHAEITQQLRGREAVLRDLLKECRYPLLVAKADAESAGEQEDLELLGGLLRKINAALAAIAQGADEGERNHA